jgi:hypothetical protein
LWQNEGVRVWDKHKQEEFDLRALLFITINDWPTLSNLLGHTNKGYNTYTHCLDKTKSIYLGKSKKVVYSRHRQFLPPRHAIRKKDKHFKDEVDPQPKPAHRTGEDVFGMVNDLKVIFRKGPSIQSIPNDANGHAPI